MPDTLTPGTYLRQCREAAGLAIADVAAAIPTEPRWAEHVRAEQLDLIERDVRPASFATIVALSLAYPIDFTVIVGLTRFQSTSATSRAPAGSAAA